MPTVKVRLGLFYRLQLPGKVFSRITLFIRLKHSPNGDFTWINGPKFPKWSYSTKSAFYAGAHALFTPSPLNISYKNVSKYIWLLIKRAVYFNGINSLAFLIWSNNGIKTNYQTQLEHEKVT